MQVNRIFELVSDCLNQRFKINENRLIVIENQLNKITQTLNIIIKHSSLKFAHEKFEKSRLLVNKISKYFYFQYRIN